MPVTPEIFYSVQLYAKNWALIDLNQKVEADKLKEYALI